MTEKSIKEQINEIESQLKIPVDFLWVLRQEDDWSYIVKMHSLIEAAITYLIVHKIDKTELKQSISQLELSNNRSGKIAFLKDLNLLERHRKFIKRFSELRNKFIHNVSNISLSLDSILHEETELKNNLVNSMKPFIKETVIHKGKEMSGIDFAQKNIRHAIFISVISMFEEIYFHTKRLYSFAELLGTPMGLLDTVKAEREKLKKDESEK